MGEMKILVVDDDPDLLLLTTQLLRKAGYEVGQASTGKECLEILLRDHPDLVLLDVMLPDMTGIELCRHIKSDERLRSTFVILLSGVQTSSEYQADGLNVGADGYLVKPVSNKELLARVQAMLRIKGAEDALHASELRYRRLFETTQDGILILNSDTGVVEDVNPSLLSMLGYTREELLGKNCWKTGLFGSSDEGETAFRELQQQGTLRHQDVTLVTKQGQEITVQCVSNLHDVEERKLVQCNVRDVTERKRLEEKLQRMSLLDDLTGLYNRRGFFVLSEQQLRIAERARQELLLFFADLDNLKEINDAWGHQEGDQALIEIAGVLKETFRKSDIIGRLGGDEFAVLAVDTADGKGSALIGRLENALDACGRRSRRRYPLSLSAGVARYDPGNPSSLDALIAQADALMYEKKRTRQG